MDFLINITLRINRVGNVKEVLYIYKNNANSASHNNREQLKFNDMLAVYRAIGELTYDYNVGEAILCKNNVYCRGDRNMPYESG